MTKRSVLSLLAGVSMLFALLPFAAASAAPASDVFFSEYIEGSGYNKALEIYNGTNGTIDLSTYSIDLYSNANTSPNASVTLVGSVAAGDTFVIVLDDSRIDPALLALADQESNAINANGDDTYVLRNGSTNVDSFGQVAARVQWGKDVTLVRLPVICAGDTDPNDAFDPDDEWIAYPKDDFSHLGTHTSDCGPDGSTTTTEPPTGPGIVINEVDSDTPGTDAAEFIELAAASGGVEDLSGLSLVFYNGSNDLSYDAIDLDGYSTGSDGYFVLCSASGNVANCDYPGAFSDNGVQNGPDAVVLIEGDAVDYPNDSVQPDPSAIVDAIVYDTNDGDDAGLAGLIPSGHAQYNEDAGGDKDHESNQRCPDVTGLFTTFIATPGAENCIAPIHVLKIHDVQGSGDASPYAGQKVEVEGVVVGDYEGFPGLGGFFVQEEDADVDGDPATSEGIFVFTGDATGAVAEGDVVRLVGTATEFHGLTQISGVDELEVTGTGTVTTTAVALPVTDTSDWERYEGMKISFAQTLYVTETYTLGQYGEVMLSSGGPFDNPTNVVAPGAPANALAAANQLDRIQLDDGITWSNIDPTPYLGMGGTLRGGDTVTGLTGVLGYSFGVFEVQPVGTVNFSRANDRPTAAPSVGGTLTVGSFNVLNYFSTIDGGSAICGPDGNQGCRGADSVEEFALQKAKIVNAIVKMDADVVGLMEIENHATDAAVQDLVDGLNALAGAGTYDYVATGPVGTDAIKVAIVYKPASVTPTGAYAVLDSSVDPTFNEDKNRPALAQTFTENASDEAFTVVVNHLKSKGSDCDVLGDPDAGDGQGNCNGIRTAAATALASWLASDPTGSGDADAIIIGDLNSYAKEDPIAALKGAGFTDLIQTHVGEGHAAGAYSYVFQGEWGYLDHALANSSLAAQVTGAAFWHINSDEPPALDYNSWNNEANQTTDEFRSSDHDPVVVGLYLGGPRADITRAKSALEDALPTGGGYTDRTVKAAIRSLDKALRDRNWDGETVDSHKVFDEIAHAILKIELADRVGTLDDDVADEAVGYLVRAARISADEAIAAASIDPVAPKHLAHAQWWMDAGDRAAGQGYSFAAVLRYRQAWVEAGRALTPPWWGGWGWL